MKITDTFFITILLVTKLFAQNTEDPAFVIDIDGNTYNIIEIGNQIWMAEDLRVTHYPNGDPIPNVTTNSAWAGLADNDIADAYSFYNNNTNTDYGALYSYAAAIGDNWERDSTEGQGICPNGWHLPTDAEWTVLVNYLGGSGIAGGKMKEVGTAHWASPNTGATNESDFTALPGGYRDYSCGAFGYSGSYAGWWTATEYTEYPTRAFRYLINTNSGNINRSFNQKSYGFSVRCMKNEEITYTVTFIDWDGTGIDTVQVEEGNDAIPPGDPSREGYVFTGWDTDFTNVTSDLTVTAQYSITDYNITYNNVGTLNAVSNPSGYTIETADITLTAPNDSIGYNFGGWFTNATFSDTVNTPAIATGSTGDMDFHARWLVQQLTVTFNDWDESLIEEQSVNYGNDATAPADPIRAGYNFTGWDTDFTNVTSDLTVTAQYDIASSIHYTDEENSKIYPNPVTGILHINSDKAFNRIEISDITGNVVLSQKTGNNSVDVSKLKNGIYFVKIENKVYRIIKNE